MKHLFHLIIIISIGILYSCSDDEDCGKETFNQMGNNPVKTIDWLIKLKDGSKQTESTILLYKWNENTYYYVYKALTEGIDDAPYIFIYKSDGTLFASCGGFENAESTNALRCNDFHKNAKLSAELWSYIPCDKKK